MPLTRGRAQEPGQAPASLSTGQPVSMVYCLRFGGVDHFYQTGRDPKFE
jgi:hypothetical protein